MRFINLEDEDIINFPTGKIKKVNEIIENGKLSIIIKNPTIRRNLAYAIQFTNVIGWMLKKTDWFQVQGSRFKGYNQLKLQTIIIKAWDNQRNPWVIRS